jgi:hypothetical protein
MRFPYIIKPPRHPVAPKFHIDKRRLLTAILQSSNGSTLHQQKMLSTDTKRYKLFILFHFTLFMIWALKCLQIPHQLHITKLFTKSNSSGSCFCLCARVESRNNQFFLGSLTRIRHGVKFVAFWSNTFNMNQRLIYRKNVIFYSII